MGILHPAIGITAHQPHARRQADELARLGAEVARLEAERAALSWAAGHDELTGLPNRRLLAALAVPRIRAAGRPAAVVVLDLNGFKPVNDRYGHQAGDLVLREMALRIAAWSGANPAGRIGGDEFAAVLTGSGGAPWSGRHWWEPCVAALSAAVARPVAFADATVTLSAALGVAAADGTASFPDLLNRADLAMYRAKAAGDRYAAWNADEDAAWNADEGATVVDPESSIELSVFPAAPRPAAGRQPAAPRSARPAGRPQPPPSRPEERPTTDVAPANTYHHGDPVWVHRYGAWRPGVVDAASPRAVMTTYRCSDGMATVVDTVSAEYVVLRAGTDAPAPRSHPSEVAA
jgi:diguanylate cyclase (GGDEF)-like protein